MFSVGPLAASGIDGRGPPVHLTAIGCSGAGLKFAPAVLSPTMPAPIGPRKRREDGAPPNWDRSLDPLAPSAVPNTMRSWYVRPFEAFLRDVWPDSLLLLREGECAGYLQRVSSRSQLVDWEFRHSEDALQLMIFDVAQVQAGNPAGKATVRFFVGHCTLSSAGCRLKPRRTAVRPWISGVSRIGILPLKVRSGCYPISEEAGRSAQKAR